MSQWLEQIMRAALSGAAHYFGWKVPAGTITGFVSGFSLAIWLF